MSNTLEKSFLILIDKKRKRIESRKTISMKDIGRQGHHIFECEAFTFLQQHNSPQKYFRSCWRPRQRHSLQSTLL